MSRSLLHNVRLFFSQAWLSYHTRFAITHPFGYFTAKFGFSFFLMIFFIFMGKFVGFTNPLYIIIGNIILIPANSGACGLTLAIGEEREWGTLSYVIGSPASRALVFIGRATFYIIDGFATALIGLGFVALIFKMDTSLINLPLLLVCILLVSITSTGLGFVFGSISLINRDSWTILSTFLSALYILVGVNFPVDALPWLLQKVAYLLPLTRGLMAARLILNGAGWGSINSLMIGEILVGVVYILLGYLYFIFIEKRSTISGTLDAY
jgi:ABC-2 type transport system permease protein